MKIIIIGNGKLARSIIDDFNKYSNHAIQAYSPGMEVDKSDIFVHVGSGRQYQESLDLAKKLGAAYIQAATEKNVKLTVPSDNRIIYLQAPNLDTNIIKLFYWLKMANNLFDSEAKSILESHQQEKTSQPGTALKICRMLKISPEELVSLRDPEEQAKLNIHNLKHHAFHRIQIGSPDSQIVIETKIEGCAGYVRGLAKIVNCFSKLKKRVYQVEELVELNLL